MAHMIPQRSEAQLDALTSRAEARFYRACRDQLDSRLVVFHSVCFLRQSSMRAPVDGEADFVIFDPFGGFLVVEVKGGGIARDRQVDQWFSTNRSGRHEINDPIWQARTEKHAIHDLLLKHPRWCGSKDRILAGHAVFFPDVGDVRPFVCPELTLEMVGGRDQLKALQAWYDRVTGYWKGQDPRFRPLGTEGMDVVKKIFSDPIEARALMSVQLEDEERRRIRLTDEQSRLLRSLGSRKKAKICGGAGTGKTVLALEQARRLALEGRKTLLLCFNRPLAEYLKATAGDVPGLLPMSYHQLCEWAVSEVLRLTGKDLFKEARSANPGAHEFDVIYPYALAMGAMEAWPETFDAIIIDEGQDFGTDYWMSLELLLGRATDPVFMVFYDQNQAVYKRLEKCPVQEEPFVLTRNCRNTRYIHEAAYRYFQGDLTDPSEIEGTPLERMIADHPQEQAKLIHKQVSHLLSEHRVSPEEIVILVANNKAKHTYYSLLKHQLLPNGVKWTQEVHRTKNMVLMDTVHRYKGLEAGVLFAWGLDELVPKQDREIIYVAFSRAKSRLFLVGREVSCRTLMAPTFS